MWDFLTRERWGTFCGKDILEFLWYCWPNNFVIRRDTWLQYMQLWGPEHPATCIRITPPERCPSFCHQKYPKFSLQMFSYLGVDHWQLWDDMVTKVEQAKIKSKIEMLNKLTPPDFDISSYLISILIYKINWQLKFKKKFTLKSIEKVKQMTGETPEVRSDKRKPREDRQNHVDIMDLIDIILWNQLRGGTRWRILRSCATAAAQQSRCF